MERLIIRYELARQSVQELSRKRSLLLGACDGFDTTEDNHGQIISIGQTCGREAFLFMEGQNNNVRFDELVSFEDAFTMYINDEEGACASCLKAYKIKNNELATAKREFGNAKRSLSYRGKVLLKKGFKDER